MSTKFEMAEDNIDDILTRLDEVEQLQAELRHLVPRVTSGSSSRHARHQDLSRDSPTSIRFPSLFTFPVISNFTSTSKNERVQKSAARLNLNSNSLGGNRHSRVNLRNAGSSQSGMREANVFKNLLRTSSYARHSSASTSIVDSKAPIRTRTIASRVAKEPQETIKKRLKSETSKTAVRDKTQRTTGERSNVQLPKNENVNSSEWSIF